MPDENKNNLRYFESITMKGLFEVMDVCTQMLWFT